MDDPAAASIQPKRLPIPALIKRNTLYFALAQAMQGAVVGAVMVLVPFVAIARIREPSPGRYVRDTLPSPTASR